MRAKPKTRIPTEASRSGMVGLGGLFDGAPQLPEPAGAPSPPPTACKPGRVVIRREKAGRGGKTVLVLDQFATHLTVVWLENLLGRLRKSCACGGTIQGRTLELQGGAVPRVRQVLEAEGFQVGGLRE